MKAAFSGLLLAVLTGCATIQAQPPAPSIQRGQTADGVEFGVWGTNSGKPAPILFVLSGTIDGTLEKPTYRQCGDILVEYGYLCVSIDLPCHGTQQRDGEPSGLTGWSLRAAQHDDFVEECNSRLSRVLDHLIMTGVADREQVAACGTSRGGFLAIHFAAHDHRVKCAVGFAPVTDLAVLREFQQIQEHSMVQNLSLTKQAEKLTGRPVWVVIGDRDDRVGTADAFAFISRLNTVAREKNIPSQTELHIISEPRGHTTPTEYRLKPPAEWIHRQLTGKQLPASASSADRSR